MNGRTIITILFLLLVPSFMTAQTKPIKSPIQQGFTDTGKRSPERITSKAQNTIPTINNKRGTGYTINPTNNTPKVTFEKVSLHVSSSPAAALIYIDDQYVGQTNMVIPNLSAKSYKVRISKPGYQDKTYSVNLAKVHSITAYLEKRP